jgi:type III secretion system FlhB-like substrate exporter
MLRKILRVTDLDLSLRESAAVILALNEGADAIPAIAELAVGGSWYAQEIIKHVREYGGLNPY